jgi:hypothetical protein
MFLSTGSGVDLSRRPTDSAHFDFFKHVLSSALKRDVMIASSASDADVLLESHFGPSALKSKRWVYSIFFSGEASIPLPEHIGQYSLILGNHSLMLMMI